MDTVIKIEIEDIIARTKDIGNVNFCLFQDKIIILDIDRMLLPAVNSRGVIHYPLIKINFFCLIMVERGEGIINIDYRPFRVAKNMVVVLSYRHIIHFVPTSDNFRCHNLLFPTDLLRDMFKETQVPIPDTPAFSFFHSPVIQLEQEEFIILLDNMERLRHNIHRNDHAFCQKLVLNEMENLFFELGNILLLKISSKSPQKKHARRELIIASFFKLLLDYSRTEREVAFYAEKLCVTPVYLLRAVKCTIGKPAIKLIHELAISDAMYLLRKPDMTIQNAADIMNFPDDKTFSKFFKKVSGVSPGEYRKKVRTEN